LTGHRRNAQALCNAHGFAKALALAKSPALKNAILDYAAACSAAVEMPPADLERKQFGKIVLPKNHISRAVI
jgi:hypothetical protein